ncbi:MAG: type IV pilus assembly protein PilM [Kiritimatiellae bacterium]|nr:type IV pilus assembly protein PilM [Kiritimatiellia bacterium]
MAKKILTLNIGASTVSLAEFEASRSGSLKLVNYGMAALSAPLDAGGAEAVLAPAIMEIVRERGIRPGDALISVPGQMVFPRFADIPAAGGSERFEQMVRYEIEQNIPFPIDEMICDRQIVGETEAGDKSVMIVAAKADQMEEISAAAKSAGFLPEVIDVAPIAATNLLKRLHPQDENCSVILDIGAKTTSLVIVDGNRLYTRSIPVAGNMITKEICQALGCDFAEGERLKREIGYVALGGTVEDEDETRDRVSKACRTVMARLHAEVSRSVNFYRSQQGGAAPQKLYLAGGSSVLPQLDGFLAENLQIEVEYLNPFDLIEIGPKIDRDALEADAAQLVPVAALALRAAGEAAFAINLVPASIVNERADAAKIPFAAVAAVALIGSLVATYVAVNRQTEVVKSALEVAESKVGTLKSFEAKVKKALDAESREKAKADELLDLFGRRGAALAALNAVRSAIGPDLWIEKWEGERVTIRGWADDVARLVARNKTASGAGKSTASEIVAERLRAMPQAVDTNSVQIAEMTTVGKNAEIEQFALNVKFAKGGER